MNCVFQNISKISPLTINNNNVRKYSTPTLKKDSVSFSSSNILRKSSQEISEIVKEAVTNKSNFIGEGTEGIVYNIPRSGLCVKIPRKKIKEYGNWSLNVLPSERVNHIVAKNDNKVCIMKKIEGVPLNKMDNIDFIFDLPKNCFKDLLIQIKDASNARMLFDDSLGNIIFNQKTKRLTAIDFVNPTMYLNSYNYEYMPFSQVYQTFSSRFTGNSYYDNNKKLGIKLLDIAVDELGAKKPAGCFICQEDMNEMFEKMRYSHGKFKLPHIDELKELMTDIIKIRLLTPPEQRDTDRLEKEIRVAKKVLNEYKNPV